MERPILFNTDMVKAILDGRKTQTRRIVKPQPLGKVFNGFVLNSTCNAFIGTAAWGNDELSITDHAKPPCQVGDTLWVRETFYQYGEWFDIPQTDEYGDVINKRTFIPQHESKYPIYFADTLPKDLKILKGYKSGRGYYKRPSLFMPRSAARIFLKVTDVRVERLQDIDSRGAWNEGVRCKCMHPVPECAGNKTEFIKLWDGIYHNWNENPWVWVIEFEKLDLCEHGISDYCQKADGCTYCTEDMI